MKKLFTYLGISTLACISFIITEKTALVVKENDELMQEIKKNQENYNQEPIPAIINEETMIPGINGKKIDIEKTYEEMKKIGTFNDKYLIYKTLPPSISYKNHYDKYIISGNPKKNMISLLFMVYEKDNITKIIDILKENKATFFVDGKWFEQNNELAIELIKQGHTIGNLSYNMNYGNTDYIWINNILKKIGKQKQGYCYYTDNQDNLKACQLQQNYTIKPSIIIENSPLTQIKKNITSGSIISLKINEETIKELPLIITYIKQKGYQIDTLTNHLNEENEI